MTFTERGKPFRCTCPETITVRVTTGADPTPPILYRLLATVDRWLLREGSFSRKTAPGVTPVIHEMKFTVDSATSPETLILQLTYFGFAGPQYTVDIIGSAPGSQPYQDIFRNFGGPPSHPIYIFACNAPAN